MRSYILTLALLTSADALRADPPRFEAQTIDDKISIGYGLAIGDVNGDGKPDVLLADQHEFVWYENPGWTRRVIWKNPAQRDNVCLAARDLDGDGKVEVAGGAEWAPGDRVDSGSVHWFQPPSDRTQAWPVVNLHREPTVHRMRWLKGVEGPQLIVAPLHGRADDPTGGARVLAYSPPGKIATDPAAWKLELVDAQLHALHNFEVLNWDGDPEEEVLLAGKEGVFLCDYRSGRWTSRALAGNAPGESDFPGASEVRVGKLARKGRGRFLATIEPFHGNQLVAYTRPPKAERGGARPRAGLWTREVIDASLNQGHAVATGRLGGPGPDAIVAGWRGGKGGIRIYEWSQSGWKAFPLDEGGIACEDLRLADLDGDGKLDVIAAGRASKNVKIYWNRG